MVVASGVKAVKELCLTGCVNFYQIVPNILAAYNNNQHNNHNKHNKHNSSGEDSTFSLTAAQAVHPLVSAS